VAGHLDAHHTGSVDADARTTLDALPDADRLRANGAAMARDQLVAYIVEHLPNET